MAEPKTKPTKLSVTAFLRALPDKAHREDGLALMKLMKAWTGEEPQMWGPSIVGFGTQHYVYESGREGDWPIAGFSPRKQNLTVYIMPGFDRYGELLKQLGKHKTGKSCLYFNRLADVDTATLKKLVQLSVKHAKKGKMESQ